MGFHAGWNAVINTFDPATVKIELNPDAAFCTHEFKWKWAANPPLH